MMGRDGSSAGGFSPLNALRAVVALLIVAGLVVIAAHYVMPTGKTKPKPNPRVQATTVRSATVAQVFAATAARLRELKGQNVRERTVMTMSMSTAQASATVQQTTTLDLAPPDRGRTITVHTSRRSVTGGASESTREWFEYLTVDGGTTTYGRALAERWTRIGGGSDRWLFASPQRGLLFGTHERDCRLAGYTRLGGVECVLLTWRLTEPQGTVLLDQLAGYGMKPPGKIERSAHGSETLWIDTSDSTVLRDVADVQGHGAPGTWHYRCVQDLSRWGEPVTPPIVLPKGL
jgi:hypothetical protein